MLADTGSYSPLTARLSPDMQALKLKQIAAKMQPHSGESILMQKAREHDARTNRGKPVGSEKVRNESIFGFKADREIYGGALSCAVNVARLRRMDGKMRGQWWQKNPQDRRALPLKCSTQVTTSRRPPIETWTQRLKHSREQNTGVVVEQNKYVMPKQKN